jgi:coenzyme F420-reducing hydrogenase delta subunit
MFNLSAAMANTFVIAAEEMTEKIRALGPNPLKKKLSTLAEEEEL